jgi:trehalose-6-phosphatase
MLVGPAVMHPNVVVSSSHGMEKRLAGSSEPLYSAKSKAQIFLAELHATKKLIDEELAFLGLPVKHTFSEERGVHVNIKEESGAIEVHYRTCPEFHEQVLATFTLHCNGLITAGTHEYQPGDCVAECRMKGATKGTLAAEEIAEFQPDFVVMAGDDKTDFHAMNEVFRKMGDKCAVVLVGDIPTHIVDKQTNQEWKLDVPAVRLFRVRNSADVGAFVNGLADKFGAPPIADPTWLPAHPYYKKEHMGR